MFFIIRFIIFWVIWLLLAHKSRWREILPVSIFAGFLGATTDNFIRFYRLWDYESVNETIEPIIYILDDWGVYIVVSYLFIQWLPRKKTYKNMILYWLLWTGIAIAIEWIHISTNHMSHHKWWNSLDSYIADWILFFIFYKFYKIFKLYKLREPGDKEDIPLKDLGDIVLIIDSKGVIKKCNGKWLKDHNINPESSINKTVYELKGEMNRDLHFDIYNKVLRGNSISSYWKWTDLDGKTYTFFSWFSPIKGTGEGFDKILCISNEIPSIELNNTNNLLVVDDYVS